MNEYGIHIYICMKAMFIYSNRRLTIVQCVQIFHFFFSTVTTSFICTTSKNIAKRKIFTVFINKYTILHAKKGILHMYLLEYKRYYYLTADGRERKKASVEFVFQQKPTKTKLQMRTNSVHARHITLPKFT